MVRQDDKNIGHQHCLVPLISRRQGEKNILFLCIYLFIYVDFLSEVSARSRQFLHNEKT